MTPLFKRIARSLATDAVTRLEAKQIEAWLGNTDGTWLDVGCGWGRHMRRLRRKGRLVVGVDRDADHAGKRVLLKEFAQLSPNDCQVDAAYSWQNSLFCCTPTETVESLKGVARALKPDGKLLLQNTSTTAAAKYDGAKATVGGVTANQHWYPQERRLACTLTSGDQTDAYDIYCYERDAMEALLSSAGFRLVRWEDDGANSLTLATSCA